MGGPAGSSGWERAALPRGLFGLGTEHVLSRVTLGCPISLAGCSVYWGPRWEPHLPHPFPDGCDITALLEDFLNNFLGSIFR